MAGPTSTRTYAAFAQSSACEAKARFREGLDGAERRVGGGTANRLVIEQIELVGRRQRIRIEQVRSVVVDVVYEG